MHNPTAVIINPTVRTSHRSVLGPVTQRKLLMWTTGHTPVAMKYTAYIQAVMVRRRSAVVPLLCRLVGLVSFVQVYRRLSWAARTSMVLLGDFDSWSENCVED